MIFEKIIFQYWRQDITVTSKTIQCFLFFLAVFFAIAFPKLNTKLLLFSPMAVPWILTKKFLWSMMMIFLSAFSYFCTARLYILIPKHVFWQQFFISNYNLYSLGPGKKDSKHYLQMFNQVVELKPCQRNVKSFRACQKSQLLWWLSSGTNSWSTQGKNNNGTFLALELFCGSHQYLTRDFVILKFCQFLQ